MSHPGTLHLYAKRLTAFEHASTSPDPTSNLILWIGGLGDTLMSVRYPASIAKALPPTWTIAEVLLSSANDGWGTGSLARDAAELAKCIAFFKGQRPGAKIVLMGHSTGCQDIMEYLTGSIRYSDVVDGAILQAGVSDRQGWDALVADDAELGESLKAAVELARKLVESGDGDVILPKKGSRVLEMFESPCTAYRADSLFSFGGDDDYFSTDLPEEKLRGTFGKVPRGTKMMFLWGSKDPYIPADVDQEGTLKMWARYVKEGGGAVDEVNGGVIQGATHNLNRDDVEVVQDLVGRVVRFVEGL